VVTDCELMTDVSRCFTAFRYRCHFHWWCNPDKSVCASIKNEGVREWIVGKWCII